MTYVLKRIEKVKTRKDAARFQAGLRFFVSDGLKEYQYMVNGRLGQRKLRLVCKNHFKRKYNNAACPAVLELSLGSELPTVLVRLVGHNYYTFAETVTSNLLTDIANYSIIEHKHSNRCFETAAELGIEYCPLLLHRANCNDEKVKNTKRTNQNSKFTRKRKSKRADPNELIASAKVLDMLQADEECQVSNDVASYCEPGCTGIPEEVLDMLQLDNDIRDSDSGCQSTTQLNDLQASSYVLKRIEKVKTQRRAYIQAGLRFFVSDGLKEYQYMINGGFGQRKLYLVCTNTRRKSGNSGCSAALELSLGSELPTARLVGQRYYSFAETVTSNLLTDIANYSIIDHKHSNRCFETAAELGIEYCPFLLHTPNCNDKKAKTKKRTNQNSKFLTRERKNKTADQNELMVSAEVLDMLQADDECQEPNDAASDCDPCWTGTPEEVLDMLQSDDDIRDSESGCQSSSQSIAQLNDLQASSDDTHATSDCIFVKSPHDPRHFYPDGMSKIAAYETDGKWFTVDTSIPNWWNVN